MRLDLLLASGVLRKGKRRKPLWLRIWQRFQKGVM